MTMIMTIMTKMMTMTMMMAKLATIMIIMTSMIMTMLIMMMTDFVNKAHLDGEKAPVLAKGVCWVQQLA